MDGSWDYHTKWNKSERKSWDPCDFTHIWDIKLKATENWKQDKQIKTEATV